MEFIERYWRWALALLMLADAAVLFYMGRGLNFFFDDWDFVIHDYGGGIHSLLAGHVGNFVLFPVLVYKVLFHLVGLHHYAVFRLVVIFLHLTCGGLVFVLASRRVSRANALLAAALILFLGAAWEDLLWAFQVTYLLSVAGGLVAWVSLGRRGRWSEVAAMFALLVAVGSSSLGIALIVGVAVELAWERRLRSAWIVLIPAFLYLLWYLGYGESQLTANGLINAPGFAEDLAAAAFGGLAGRALEWGRPLALVGAGLVFVHLARPIRITGRLAGLLATALALWTVTAVARSTISQPETSRYIYLGAVVIVLVGVEMLRDVTISPRAVMLGAVAVAFCALAGLTVLHDGAEGLRSDSTAVTAELGALEIAAAYVPADYQPDPQRAPQIVAGPYLHTVRAIGSSPADSPAQIIASDTAMRTQVDEVLTKLEAIALVSATGNVRLAAAPPLLANVNGSSPVHDKTQCWSTTAIGPGSYAEFLQSPGGFLIRAGAQPVDVVVRRFAPPPAGVDLGDIAAHATDLLKFPVDASGRPWFARVSSSAPVKVCGVGP